MTSIKYREPSGIEELEAVFRLRFDVYANDGQLHSLVPHAFGSDLGTYDVNGLHFAAFEDQQPVAYLRMTMDSPTHFAPLVQQLMQAEDTVQQTNLATFPFLGYYPDKAWSEAFLRSLQGRKIGEVGRLVVHTGYRQGSVLSGLIATSGRKKFWPFLCFEKQFRISSALNNNERYYKIADFHFESSFGGSVSYVIGFFINKNEHRYNKCYVDNNLHSVIV